MTNPLSIPADRPTQAVILAGGRGTRLGALTANRPKPMVEFHGRPFLEYLLESVRAEGFDRVQLLVGYQANVIRDYFGEGSRCGLSIRYSVADADTLTAERLQMAASAIDPCFLLMYCDNYWPMRFAPMWKQFADSDAAAQITVYSNRDGYTRDNVRVAADGRVLTFDKQRTSPGLDGVEIGYAIVRKSVLDLLPATPSTFEEAVYPQLAARGQLLAHVTDHRYYSVGSLPRLPLTDEFFARRPAVLLDRDGVLNRRPRRGEYVRDRQEFEWLPGARAALRALAEADYRVIIVSNQAGVARGAMTAGHVEALHAWMREDARAAGGHIDAIYYCPHGWDEGCACRKPRAGMLFQAQRDFNLDLTRTLFVGDDERDEQAAQAAGSSFEMVTADRSLADIVGELVNERIPVEAAS
jgi:D-glycero-D-manno-heptose 1,7-bisphosphate phosphatase